MRRLLVVPVLLASTIVVANSTVPSANADEIWISEGRLIQWFDSRGDTAILKMQNTGGNNVYFYIVGLASDVTNRRGSYGGFWVTRDDGKRQCSTSREFYDGRLSYNWGRLEINFTGNSFPYKWTARYGQCDRKLDQSMEAVPMLQAN